MRTRERFVCRRTWSQSTRRKGNSSISSSLTVTITLLALWSHQMATGSRGRKRLQWQLPHKRRGWELEWIYCATKRWILIGFINCSFLRIHITLKQIRPVSQSRVNGFNSRWEILRRSAVELEEEVKRENRNLQWLNEQIVDLYFLSTLGLVTLSRSRLRKALGNSAAARLLLLTSHALNNLRFFFVTRPLAIICSFRGPLTVSVKLLFVHLNHFNRAFSFYRY